MLPNCTAFIWGTDSFPGTVYYRDDLPAGCPSSPEPLTPAEQCLVGRFRIVHNTTFDMGTFVYERKEHRTETMNQFWSDTQTTTVRQWRIKDSKLCRLAPDGYEDCGFVIDWDEVRSSRETSEPPGCEYPDSSPPPPAAPF